MTDDLPHSSESLEYFQPILRKWFTEAFPAPTDVQTKAWPIIARGENTLLLAPTGSGKTLAAFLVAINRIMFDPKRISLESLEVFALSGEKRRRRRRADNVQNHVRVLYISPLKALGVDVERNLRSPIAGVRAVAQREGASFHLPTVGVRSGDTPSQERQRLRREPPDILITTPESLYLLLTSSAAKMLAQVETVIIDEIHTMVASKRGSHLFVSLERLERLRRRAHPDCPRLQRIGLSATQRPLEEVARLLGGAEATPNPDDAPKIRPVEIVEAGKRKQLELTIEVPVEDMTKLGELIQTGPAANGPTVGSIWPSIHPRLVELIRSHHSTMIFVNSRRLAERLANAINELAEEELALAHHGSIAKDTRLITEDRLKRGTLPAIVATSSLELGIDMGAVDLVVQIEAPPSIASGMQRIGRAGHQVGVPSKGIIFPKYRGDLLAASAASQRMLQGEVEESFYPRNPLDVLAQQIVAVVSEGPISVDDLYATMRGAAPFTELPRSSFEGVLDLLAGRYPSHEFSELRPRLVWDRIAGEVTPRKGTQRIAILNAGTIPDRGLYGVFLVGEGDQPGSRVGELDEEMVFETHEGDVFLLGASSWRVLEITHDRVVVSPAPGEPGRMPFWKGDGPGRPLEFGRAIGKLAHRLATNDAEQSRVVLMNEYGLDDRAAFNLLNYIHEQVEATGEPPSDCTIIVESFIDEVGDWRVVILSPFGSRVHAPWATAVAARLRAETVNEIDMMWTDDGLVFRLPESDEPPPISLFFPGSDEIEEMVVRELGSTALFAARFRENAARALLLPKRQPNRRTPLWVQRRKSADLLAVAARYESFPILLETYRECLRDVFDLRGLKELLHDIERQVIRVQTVHTRSPSPFASSVMFNYTASFIYNGDTPLAERRAAALALDHRQLRELLGDAELRELLDPNVVDELAIELARLDPRYRLKNADSLHDLLQLLGDLTREEIIVRCDPELIRNGELEHWLSELIKTRRIFEVRIAGEKRFVAAEDAARLRDALGIVPPVGLPTAFLEGVRDPLADLIGRFARTHVPFPIEVVAQRFGLGVGPIRTCLQRLVGRDRVVEGEFLPGGRGREWCDVEVLRQLKRRSLARLRKQVEPVDPQALGRFLPHWQGIARPRRGLDGLLDAIDQLQGASLPASDLERDILPARVVDYRPSDLDELCAAGEVVWRGRESLGTNDGRIALFLTDRFTSLATLPLVIDDDLAKQIFELLQRKGALFFEDILRETGGFRHDVIASVWRLVWAGHVTNDTLAPLRSLWAEGQPRQTKRRTLNRFRSRRTLKLPGSEGRWSVLNYDEGISISSTEKATALAGLLVQRYGVLTRELVASEGVAGGFSAIYPVLKAMEESGRLRRGYFVAGQGAAQFALPGADETLRSKSNDLLDNDAEPETFILAATDPANPYGSTLRWPEISDEAGRPQRATASRVVLCDGMLTGYISRTGRSLLTFLPEIEPDRSRIRGALVRSLAEKASKAEPVYFSKIDGQSPTESELADELRAVGFIAGSKGWYHRGKESARA